MLLSELLRMHSWVQCPSSNNIICKWIRCKAYFSLFLIIVQINFIFYLRNIRVDFYQHKTSVMHINLEVTCKLHFHEAPINASLEVHVNVVFLMAFMHHIPSKSFNAIKINKACTYMPYTIRKIPECANR